MEDLFEMMTVDDQEESKEKGICLGIRIRVSGKETTCPVSQTCESFDMFESEVRDLKAHLDRVLDQGKAFFRASRLQGKLDIRSDMPPDEIWTILSQTEDESLFVEGFNCLEESKRKEVAEHVLTKCNVFSGKASVFSSRYSDESSFME